MINLVGCTKKNFLTLIGHMDYKYEERNKDIFFRYFPKKTKNFKKNNDKLYDSPFNVLSEVQFK